MINPRKLIIPAIIFSSTVVIFLTRALSSPDQLVFAESESPHDQLELTIDSSGVTPQSEVVGSDCSIPSSYPDDIRQWCRQIEQVAHYYGLDPNLVAAVMLQESGGNPEAYSKSGAVGLMQVMPRDGLAEGYMCINGPCFSSRPSTEELLNPEFNIEFGTELLSGLISRYGDIREGLRAYGPMNSGYAYADIVLAIYNRYQ